MKRLIQEADTANEEERILSSKGFPEVIKPRGPKAYIIHNELTSLL